MTTRREVLGLSFGGVLALVIGCFIIAMTASDEQPKRGALVGTLPSH